MKKSVIAVLLLAVLVVIVSPGIIGKLAEQSVDDNLNWAARQSGELVVTSQSFDRGWFSSEGQHRVELGAGQIRAALTSIAGGGDEPLPVLLIDTRIDHGLIPVSSLGRNEGSLAPALGSAVSTLTIEYGSGETFDVPGIIYSTVSLGGDLDSHYILDAGSLFIDDGEVTWQPIELNIAASAKTGRVEFSGDIGAMTFGNDQQIVSIDGLTFSGQQTNTQYGFNVGDVDLKMGAMIINAGGVAVGGMQGMAMTASSSVDDGVTAADLRLEMNGQTIPGFGDLSVIADIAFDGIDAAALGAVTGRLESLGTASDPGQLMMSGQEEFKDLVAAGFAVRVNQFDVALPMGTVETTMSFVLPESDRATFEWTSLLLNLVASIDIRVPEALIQVATSMTPQVGTMIGLGYLKKNGDVYELDADLKKGLLTINGAPVPVPLGAFR